MNFCSDSETKKPLIYLASPYTHNNKGIEFRREHEITYIAALLTKEYQYPMFLPITQSANMKRSLPELGSTFKYWASIDLSAIRHCSEVWVVTMNGWDTSVGVKAEIEFAHTNNKMVYYIDPLTLHKTEHP